MGEGRTDPGEAARGEVLSNPGQAGLCGTRRSAFSFSHQLQLRATKMTGRTVARKYDWGLLTLLANTALVRRAVPDPVCLPTLLRRERKLLPTTDVLGVDGRRAGALDKVLAGGRALEVERHDCEDLGRNGRRGDDEKRGR